VAAGVVTGSIRQANRLSLLKEKTFAAFPEGPDAIGLSDLCFELLSEQKKAWPDLRAGYESLEHVRTRHLPGMGFTIQLQHNPGRITNSLAGSGDDNAPQKPCFLCLKNLPEGQQGILYRGEYLILCNPRPVFPAHFTVSHIRHRPQSIDEHIQALLKLAADLGSRWTSLYNGPYCGASAPDHLHFQVVPSGQMPLEAEMDQADRLCLLRQVNGVAIYGARNVGREILIMEGDDPVALGNSFRSFLKGLRKGLGLDGEPMINMAGFRDESKWRLALFPRRKHRPDAFFREGNSRIVVSPGVIEMGGVLITPVENDFERLDARTVQAIYSEVSCVGKAVEKAINSIE
jgi:hypothetical protein